MFLLFSHGSGMVIITASGRSMPFITMNSSALSSMAESEPEVLMMGRILFMSSCMMGLEDALLTGQHGIGVALDGVDLAVVQDEAVGVGAHPAGVGVGGEAAVHHADGGFIILVLQIG